MCRSLFDQGGADVSSDVVELGRPRMLERLLSSLSIFQKMPAESKDVTSNKKTCHIHVITNDCSQTCRSERFVVR